MSLGSGLERGEGEYTGSLDFKSRTMEAFKVEDIDVMGGKEKVDNVKQETSEIIILSVREGKVTNDPLREENTGKSETWGFVKSESGHLLGSENEAKNRREDVEKVEVVCPFAHLLFCVCTIGCFASICGITPRFNLSVVPIIDPFINTQNSIFCSL